jgi:hypothetical protein
MVAIILYENETEKKQHLSAIHMLAMNSGIKEESIRQLYERELWILKEYARVKDFLSVIIIRRLKEKIKNQSAF